MSKTTLIECGFACLGITSCFSYNLAAFSDLRGKLLCELLPSDKFNNSDKFTDSLLYHHFSIPVSTNWIVLLLFFQEDQRFSQNSLRSALTFTRGSLCMVFYCSEPAGKVHGLSCSDSEVVWRKDPIRRMSKGNWTLSWFLEESYLNTHTVSISLSGEVVKNDLLCLWLTNPGTAQTQTNRKKMFLAPFWFTKTK